MSTDKADSLSKIDEFAWIRARQIGGKVAPALANIMGDGNYLAAWRLVGALALPFALLIGFWLGSHHIAYDPPDRPIYLYSVVTMVTLILVSQHGAAVGMAAWLGFVFGDLIRAFGDAGDDAKLLVLLGVWALVGASMWLLLVATPHSTRQLSRTIHKFLPPTWRTLPAAAAIHGLLLFVFVYLWCHATPALMQPVYLWQGNTPMSHGLIQTMHKISWAIAMVAAYAGVVRVVIEAFADAHPPFEAKKASMQAAAAIAPPGPARSVIGALAKAAFMTFMLSSYIMPSWTLAFTVFLILGVVLVARVVVMGMMGVGQIVLKISPWIRLPLALFLMFVVSYMTVKLFWETPGFKPILWSTVISVTIGALLLPPPAPAKPPSAKARP